MLTCHKKYIIVASAVNPFPAHCSKSCGIRVSRFDMQDEPGDKTRVNLPHKEVSINTVHMKGNAASALREG